MPIVVLLLVIGGIILVWTTVLEVRATWRRREIRVAEEVVQTRHAIRGSDAADAAVLGSGAAALSLYDVYRATEDHSHLLDLLQDRCHHAIPHDATPLQWLEHFERKFAAGERNIGGVVSNLVGTLGEHEAVDYLNSLPAVQEAGVRAELFDSRIHAGTDIHFVDSAGHDVDWPEFSVKSYGDTHAFLSELRSNPQAETFVNHEVYESLAASGKFHELRGQGLHVYDGHVYDGHFSHASDFHDANDAVDAVHSAGDVAHHIPWIGVAVFGARTVENVRKWIRHEVTSSETGVEIAGDAARVGTSVVAGVGGAKIGMAIGTVIAPGIGTIIGGGMGAIVAALGGASLIRWMKETWKYGDIMKAVREIGHYVHDQIMSGTVAAAQFANSIAHQVYGAGTLQTALAGEQQLATRYCAETSVYASSKRYAPPTPMGALVRCHVKALREQQERTTKASETVPLRIIELFVPREGAKLEYGYLGELAAANSNVFAPLLNGMSLPLEQYQAKIDSFPHHPFRFKDRNGTMLSSNDMFATVCAEEHARTPVAINKEHLPGQALNRSLMVLGIALITAPVGTWYLSHHLQSPAAIVAPVVQPLVSMEPPVIPPPPRELITLNATAELRDHPSHKGRMLRRVGRGETVLLGEDTTSAAGWTRVRLDDGQEGWIKTSALPRQVTAEGPSTRPAHWHKHPHPAESISTEAQ